MRGHDAGGSGVEDSLNEGRRVVGHPHDRISSRTLWRYFPNKEACVKPLLTAGVEAVARCLRAWAPGRPLPEALDALEEEAEAGTPPIQVTQDTATILALARLTRTEPGLRAVWLQAHADAEPAFAQALALRAGIPADDPRSGLQAAMINGAIRAAIEHRADNTTAEAEDMTLYAPLRSALLAAAQGLPD
ncbi:TetR family transcriptional regulator [Streptomyces prunicolor]|uniref:TetR family transcriptional regulator n=1 Tax=Streptomyces prunicolor TaxID=67348 RepID=A0ABU4F224_9ACTN|nr:TetR family transcriptional regulator [Streptomyces prunicolor]